MNFDEKIDRTLGCGASSSKWQGFEAKYPGMDAKGALPMWVADMDFRVPEEVTNAIQKRLDHGIFGYVSAEEPFKFAECSAAWLQRRHGLNVDPKHMVFTPGVLCGLNAAIQEFTNPGEGVIIHSPVYYPFANGITENGRVVRRNRLLERDGRYEIDFDNLETLARDPANTMFVLSSPHNPGGRVWTAEELGRMAEICMENGVLLFSDEIHSDLILPGYTHTPITSLGTEVSEHVVVSYAPSKTFNLAGLCASLQLVPNAELRARLQKRLSMNHVPRANVFGLVAGEAAYTHGDQFVDEVVAYIAENIRCFTDAVERVPGVTVMRPEGTYLLWVDFRKTGRSEDDIYRTAVERAKVAGDLGAWFGEGGEGFIRLNLACPRSLVMDAATRLVRAFTA